MELKTEKNKIKHTKLSLDSCPACGSEQITSYTAKNMYGVVCKVGHCMSCGFEAHNDSNKNKNKC